MIVFLKSEWLFLFLIFPLFFILKYFKLLSPFRFCINLLKWGETTSDSKLKKYFSISLLYKIPLFLSISALIFSIAEPCIYKTKKGYSDRGSAIMFLLDASPSMAVKDIEGSSRLEGAKNIIKYLLPSLQGNQIGLIMFAQEAYLMMVPTIDFSTFLLCLDSIELGSAQDGTDINSALTLAIANMKDSIENANLILLTDGQANSENIIDPSIFNILNLKNVNLNMIKLGVEGYANIEYFDKASKKTYSSKYYTKTNDDALKAITSSLNGTFIPIKSLKDMERIHHSLKLFQKREAMSWIQTEKKEVHFYFNLASMVLILISWSISRLFMRVI